MASASIPFSSQFTGAGISSARSTPSRRSSVGFRQPPSVVSASCATAERTATQASHYEVLGIQAGATCQEIKAAYRRLARVLHPDVASSFRRESSSDEEFIRVHAAYATLSDPQKRANYDRTLFRPGQIRPSAAFSGVNTRRNWETDQCW